VSKTVSELHDIRAEMWDASIANHLQYIDPKTALFNQKYTEFRNCPVCNKNNAIKMFIKEGGTYVKCIDCTMVYLNPVFTDEALHHYYQINHSVQSEIVETDPDGFYIDIYNQGLDSIQKVSEKPLSILDIGCSSGFFLDQAKLRTMETYGVELNENECLEAKKKGHIAYNCLLEHIDFERKFDVISMWDVFEHLKDGFTYLNHMKNLLTDDGVVFLQIPSADSLAAKILQEHCNMFDGLEHVNLYGEKTISTLAQNCGFEIASIETVISEIGVINNYLNYEDPYKGGTLNNTHIPKLIDEKGIHTNLLGYKLQIVLQKCNP
jgi:SAM-dependent methyltransferase